MIEGEVRMGGQEHFYLETQACIVIPGEDDEMEIISSTQGATEAQVEVGQCLGIPFNKIVSKVKRIGGGFGGKESAALIVTLPTAVAAYKCVLVPIEQHPLTVAVIVGFANRFALA